MKTVRCLKCNSEIPMSLMIEFLLILVDEIRYNSIWITCAKKIFKKG